VVELEAAVGPQQLVAEVTGRARLIERVFHALEHFPYFAVYVVVADGGARRVTRDRHAFDQAVRVVAHDVAVFERARLALVRIAHEILGAGKLPRHEAPLESGRETGAAASAQ